MGKKLKGLMKIHWGGFLEQAVKDYPNESAAFLFSRRPYSVNEVWFVSPIKNIAKDKMNSWQPDKRDMQRIKTVAIRNGLVKIGNVHTHPYPENIPYSEDVMQKIIKPSTKDNCAIPGNDDLKHARKYNDIIRGIICVGRNEIYDIYFHDKFGNKIDMRTE